MFWRVLAVSLLAVSAGCGTFADASEPTSTVTPVPVPEPSTETAGSTGIAPGLSGGGVRDVDRLVAAHRASLAGPAYVWQSERWIDRFPDDAGDEYVVRQELRVESERRYSFHTNRRDADSGEDVPFINDVTEYADGERTYRRFVPFGEREFTYERGSGRAARDVYAGEMFTPIRRYLAVPNATVAETRVDSESYYRVEANRDDVPGISLGRNYSVTAFVSPEGFVRSMTVSYEVRRNDRVELLRYTFRYEPRPSLTVERPDWVDEHWATASPPGRSRDASATDPSGGTSRSS